MVILHAFLALGAGFLTMATIVGVATAVLTRRVPEWVGPTSHPTVSYLAVNLGYSLLAAMAGGVVTEWLAVGNPLIHALALALIVLLLGALSALQTRGRQPLWYQLTLVALMPTGVMAGALLRLKMLGFL